MGAPSSRVNSPVKAANAWMLPPCPLTSTTRRKPACNTGTTQIPQHRIVGRKSDGECAAERHMMIGQPEPDGWRDHDRLSANELARRAKADFAAQKAVYPGRQMRSMLFGGGHRQQHNRVTGGKGAERRGG